MDIIDSFPRFRTHIARMREHGNTFVGHAPDVNDVEAMMNEIERLQQAKRMAAAIADERSKENVALRAIVDDLRTSDGIVKRDAEIERLRAALYECANLARGWTDRAAEAPDYLETIYVVACTATGEPVRALEQSAPATVNDTDRLAWLQEQIVSTIYLDDGRIIDVRGNCVRAAIDKAGADKQRENTDANG